MFIIWLFKFKYYTPPKIWSNTPLLTRKTSYMLNSNSFMKHKMFKQIINDLQKQIYNLWYYKTSYLTNLKKLKYKLKSYEIFKYLSIFHHIKGEDYLILWFFLNLHRILFNLFWLILFYFFLLINPK